MKKATIGLAVMVCLLLVGFRHGGSHKVLEYPDSWPTPVYDFTTNPLTEEGIALGRQLFYDPGLSADGSVSCANCHLSYTAFTHVDHALSHGINDSIGTRNSLSLMNLAWSNTFMWDGAFSSLDLQGMAPIHHPAEMGNNMEAVVKTLDASLDYQQRFAEVFGDSAITQERVLKALAQFELTLVSANSKYDQVKRLEPGVAFTEQEQRGYTLFQQHCNACHTEPLFTNGGFANNGLAPDSLLQDQGRMAITHLEEDAYQFKVPTLRNIRFSSPYMHDGRFEKLGQVLDHYTAGIQHSSTLAAELEGGIPLTANEKIDLQAFLLTLSDRDFLLNPDHAFPREPNALNQ